MGYSSTIYSRCLRVNTYVITRKNNDTGYRVPNVSASVPPRVQLRSTQGLSFGITESLQEPQLPRCEHCRVTKLEQEHCNGSAYSKLDSSIRMTTFNDNDYI